MNDQHVSSGGRPRLLPRQAEAPSASLGDVARDVFDHAQVIARDALAIGKIEAQRTLGRARARALEVAPRVAFGAVAAVAALTGLIFLLIALFNALEDAIPSFAWRTAIFGIGFLVVAAIGAIFAGAREKRHEAP